MDPYSTVSNEVAQRLKQQQLQQQQSQQSQAQTEQQNTLVIVPTIQENYQQITQLDAPPSIPTNINLNNNINNNPSSQQLMFKNSELLSNNFQFQQQLRQIYTLELQCLHKCNEWLQQHKSTFKITNEVIHFSTMVELEVFVVQTRNKNQQTQLSCLKWGTAFGVLISQMFFYFNSEKLFKGEQVFKITGISAIAAGLFSLLLSRQQNIAHKIFYDNVNIDFNAFELFFESCLQDIHRLRKKLVV